MKDGFKQSMPRYFKEKIFTKTQLQRLSMKAKQEAEIQEDKQIRRIQEESECDLQRAWQVYEDRIAHAYEQIRIKSKQSNSKFL
jgi:hypothetical protein